jgi:GTP-binding protein HflX
LTELNAADKPVLVVFNKTDAYQYVPQEEDDLSPPTRLNISLDELRKTWLSRIHGECVFISAVNRVNMDELRNRLTKMVKKIHLKRYPNYLQGEI